jgi:uncharacterized iron-regulated membrane protein
LACRSASFIAASPRGFSFFSGLSATTGIAYRVGKKWFGMDQKTGHFLMEIHTGEWAGSIFSTIQVLVAGLALLMILATGLSIFRKSKSRQPARLFHRVLGIALILPLAATALTGMAYKIGEEYFQISEDTADLLMDIHEGGWLGQDLKVYYVLVVGLGLLGAGLLGLGILLPKKRHTP